MGLSESVLRGLAEVTCWGTLTTDAALIITNWNRWLELASGFPAGEVVGRNLLEVYPDLMLRRMDRFYRQALGGQIVVLSQRFHQYLIPMQPSIPGTGFALMQQSVRIAPVLEDGSVVGTLTLIEDVTERIIQEEELRGRARQQAAVAALAQHALAGQSTSVLCQEIVDVLADNLKSDYCQIMELLPDGLAVRLRAGVGWEDGCVGVRSEDTGPKSHAGHVLRSTKPIILEDLTAESRFAIPALFTQHKILSGISVPIGTGTRPFGLLGVYAKDRRSFTEDEVQFLQAAANILGMAVDRKGLDDQLQEHIRRLAEADRRKDEFLAMLSHELRNPLAPIRNSVKVLASTGLDRAQLEWARDVIDRQVNQLTRLVDDLMDVSRITRGKINLRLEPLALEEIVTRAVEISRPIIDARKHRLTVALPDRPVKIRADSARLAQVVSNLLINAAKYTDEGGKIVLSAEIDGADIVIAVRDSGIGIPKDMLPHVFDLFTQINRTMDRSQGGLGIGLTLVRRLVEVHGGTVTANSEGTGRGSEFVIRIPMILEAPMQALDDRENEEMRKTLRARILVVDDNRDAAESLAMLLRLLGHEVQTAFSGPAALEAARSLPPDVALLDLGLPGMDGLELARRLRQDLGLNRAILVALTGYGRDEDRQRTQAAGFNAHLIKPVEMDSLAALLAHANPVATNPAVN